MAAEAAQRSPSGHWVRTRADGWCWCPRCATYLPPERFRVRHGAGHRTPLYTYCRSCESSYKMAKWSAWVLADPERYAAWLARTKPRRDRQNVKRLARRHAERRELKALALAAVAWLEGRGLWRREIYALAGIHRSTVPMWERDPEGMLFYRAPAERLLRLMRCAWDVPAWSGRSRRKDKAHPWFEVLAARMAEGE